MDINYYSLIEMAKNTKTAFSIGVIFVPFALAGGAAVWLWIYRKLSKNSDDKATQTEVPVVAVRQDRKKSVRGLQNLGNTCYFNSTMQALVHTNLVFREELQDLHTKGEFVLNVLEFLSYMRPKNSGPYSPDKLHRMFGKKSPKFADHRQHDSHECLRNFLDNVRKEERDSSGALDKRKVLTVVDSVFGGHFMTVYICKECETPYHVCEALLDISLPIMIDEKDLAVMNSARGSNGKKSRTVKLQTPKSQTDDSTERKMNKSPIDIKTTAVEEAIELKPSETEQDSRLEQSSEDEQRKEREEQHNDGQQHSNHTQLAEEHCRLNVEQEMQHKDAEEQQNGQHIGNADPKEVGQENKVEPEENRERVEQHEQQQELEHEERKEHERVQRQEQNEHDVEQAQQNDDTENDDKEDEDEKETDEEDDKEKDEEENDEQQNPKQDQKLEEQHDEKHILNDLPERQNKGTEEQQGGQHVSITKLKGEVGKEQREQEVEEQRHQEEYEQEEEDKDEQEHEEQDIGKAPQKSDKKESGEKNANDDEKVDEEEDQIERGKENQEQGVDQAQDKEGGEDDDKELNDKEETEEDTEEKGEEEDEEENDEQKNSKQYQKLEEQHDDKHRLNNQRERQNKGTEEQQGGQHISNAKLEVAVEEEQREQEIDEHRQKQAYEDEGEDEEKQEQEKVAERQEHGKENSPRKDDNKDGDKENEDEDEKHGEEETVVEEEVEVEGRENQNKDQDLDQEPEKGDGEDDDEEVEDKEETEEKDAEEKHKVVEKKKEGDEEQNLQQKQEGDFEVEEYASETRDLYRETVEKLMTPLSFSSPGLPNRETAINKHVTIDNCLMYFTRKEHIHKEYLCNPCYAKHLEKGGEDVLLTSATKQTMIFNPPAILTLHLKRFELKPGGSVKRTDMITYGELLDIAPYCSSMCLRNDPPCQNIWYSLYGVVVHEGSTLKSGHYFAYVKIKDNDAGFKKFLQEKYFDRDLTRDQLIEMMQEKQPGEAHKQPGGTWYCMNDSWFHEVPVEEVLNQEAYLLFYERMSQ